MKSSRTFLSTACLAIAFSGLALPAFAQQKMDHAGHSAPATSKSTSPSTKAFQASDERMMKDMAAPYTGDADRDFVTHMIPHHQGAVAMAEVLLKYGKDPELRKMAQEIVAAQEKEISFMKQWQARHPVK
jgi:uncharacterized protein (DUF305 family)